MHPQTFNIMKKIFTCITLIALMCACNAIPDKSVFEELTQEELSKAIKSEPLFGDFYDVICPLIEYADLSASQEAKYKDVTYRRLFKYYLFYNDSASWVERETALEKEWANKYQKDLDKVDETMKYWADYKEENSLNRFAKVELTNFYITHYPYVGGVDEAYICFTITPADGEIEQIRFDYSYWLKINDNKEKETKGCICTTPIAKPYEAMWEIGYWEKDNFDGMTVEKFNQKYNLEIEITDIRKDGQNYSIDDLDIPEQVIALWENDTPENRDEVAKLINPDYLDMETYIDMKEEEDLIQYDKLCHDFIELLCKTNMKGLDFYNFY